MTTTEAQTLVPQFALAPPTGWRVGPRGACGEPAAGALDRATDGAGAGPSGDLRGTPRTGAGLPALARAVVARLAADDFGGARQVLASARAGAAPRPSEPELAAVEQFTLRVLLYEGGLDDVREACGTAIASAMWRGEDGTATVATAQAMLAVVGVEQGGLEEAGRHLRSARRLAAYGDAAPRDLLMTAEVLQHEASSRTDLALRALTPLFDEPGAWADALLMGPTIVPLACRVAAAAGHRGLASRLVACAEGLAWEHGEPPALVASVDQAKGNLMDDAGLLVEAARALASSPRRLAAASAHEDAARALERSGERERALALARTALSLYTDCAATTAAQRVRQWLRGRGVNLIPGQRRGRPSFGWDAVSDAEMRVIKLVAEGLTNHEVAERLYLSRYTVDTHLRHIFAKLGIASRVTLTRSYLDHLADEH